MVKDRHVTQEAAHSMIERRDIVLARLADFAKANPRIAGLWLYGSLAAGTADPFSDIDAVLVIDDDAFRAIYDARATLIEKLGGAYSWSDGQFPSLIHALIRGGVKLDLLFQRLSAVGSQKPQTVRIVYDRGGLEPKLKTGSETPVPAIAHIVSTIIKMTRQGTTWPLRLLHRGQWSTLAMMELDLINQQIAQLMAIQRDPAYFYMSAFSLYRLLDAAQQAEIDRLTTRAQTALTARDSMALKVVHLEVFDALSREGRAACAALGTAYPIGTAEEADLRTLLEREWPG